jgi:hypothetical protein
MGGFQSRLVQAKVGIPDDSLYAKGGDGRVLVLPDDDDPPSSSLEPRLGVLIAPPHR